MLHFFQRSDSMEYEMVREIKNLCPNNQMRDVFITEVETDDPEQYVKDFLQGKAVEVSTDTSVSLITGDSSRGMRFVPAGVFVMIVHQPGLTLADCHT